MLYIPGFLVVHVYRRQTGKLRIPTLFVPYSDIGDTECLYTICSLYYYKGQTVYPYAICPLYNSGKDTLTVYFYLMPS